MRNCFSVEELLRYIDKGYTDGLCLPVFFNKEGAPYLNKRPGTATLKLSNDHRVIISEATYKKIAPFLTKYSGEQHEY